MNSQATSSIVLSIVKELFLNHRKSSGMLRFGSGGAAGVGGCSSCFKHLSSNLLIAWFSQKINVVK